MYWETIVCVAVLCLCHSEVIPINELPFEGLCGGPWCSGCSCGVVVQWWGLKELVSVSSLGTSETPSPTTFSLKPLPSGDWQTIQHSKLCKWLHCWGQIERKKGGSPGDRKARWNKKVWLCGLKRAGMDQRAGCWPAAFVRQTVLASFNLSLEATKPHRNIVLHRSHALWGQCLPASPPPIPLSPPPPLHLGQYHRWKWMGGVDVCMCCAPTCQGSTTKRAEPSLRMPGSQVLPYFGAFTWLFLLPCPGSTGTTTAWRESEQRGALSHSPGDGKPQLCGKQRWT